MSQVAIVADSTCCLPGELIKEYDISIIPGLINYKGKSYKDGIDITANEVYKIMRRKQELPTTSTPPPVEYLNIFRELAKQNRHIVCITLTSLQSHFYGVAVMAKDMLREEISGVSMEVFDSRAVAGALGFIVLSAARRAKEGANINEVLLAAKDMQTRVNFLAMVDTLYYLARTGRVAQAAVWVSNVLQIKPLLEHKPEVGETTPFARPRTKQAAIAKMLKEMERRVGSKTVHVIVHHADELEECVKFKDTIASKFNCAEIYITEFAPIMGVHAGPGVLAVAFYTD